MEAQSQAACTTVNFINEVGFQKDGDTGKKKPVYIDFQYEKAFTPSEAQEEGQEQGTSKQVTNLKVPLLTMVPIPYIRVDNASIDFNVKINSVQETTSSTDLIYGALWMQTQIITDSVLKQGSN